MDITPFIAPPGRVVQQWFEWVSVQDKTYIDATVALMKKAQNQFPNANWVVAFVTQQTPELTIASGIAVVAN